MSMESDTSGADLNFEGDLGSFDEKGTRSNCFNVNYACRNSPNPFTAVDNAGVAVHIANEHYDADAASIEFEFVKRHAGDVNRFEVLDRGNFSTSACHRGYL